MPIYEYRRPDGSTFEVLQSFSEEPLTHDPDTGVAVQRVLHAPAVHFKGSGFYNTDYGTRRRQRENAASGEGSAGQDGSSATEKGSSSTDGSGDGKAGAKGGGEGGTSPKAASKPEAKPKSQPVGAH
jgi:putative FmdB family regulatory protein